jgi:opacity protein-like surface antigen
MRMKKPLIGFVLLLAAACAIGAGVQAQEKISSDLPNGGEGNVAPDFSVTSASQVNLLDSSRTDAGARSFAMTTPEAGPSPADPTPAASPKPKYIFGDRDDYRWQLAVGVEFFRFQSSLINASLVGLNTTVAYYTNDWFAVEGNVVTGFAPEIYTNEHVKYLGGGGGVRIGTRRARFEPWGHALVGGGHLQPQTAGNSRNTFAVQAGIGLDYRLNSRLSLRAEADWVRTQFFSDVQNNYQGVAAVVFHF